MAKTAEQVSQAAVSIVAVLALAAGPGQIGLLCTAQSLPVLLLAIPLGLWADRHSRRRLMVAAKALRALSLDLLLWSVASARLLTALLAALDFADAAGTVGLSVAAPALPLRDRLGAANSRQELARRAAFAAGPTLAGAVSWAGTSAAFVLATVLSAAAVALLRCLPETAHTFAPACQLRLELKDGAGLVWPHRLLRPSC